MDDFSKESIESILDGNVESIEIKLLSTEDVEAIYNGTFDEA